ncbi:MAG TPA: FAD-dependent monooxygenase [Acidimicrobiia bacterium]|nr:FAD-dependent monooxygenase [Acidimicrobiia bacterium]
MGPGSDLVVIGAGPTGLTLALQASMLGARVRVLERRTGPRLEAPALAIHPRTMEILRGIGVADQLMSRGLSKVDLEIHIGDTTIAGSLGELRLPSTEFPFVFFAPQPEVETVLRKSLRPAGIRVEWGTTFRSWEEREGRIVSLVDIGGELHRVDSRYLAGCDGADSSVRRESGIRFRGRKYREWILVADVTVTGKLESGTAHAFLRPQGILFFFPLPNGAWRLIGPGQGGDSPGTVKAVVERHTHGQVVLGDVEWSEAVRPQHRLAETYRRGNVFLAGDAAHVHSPAGAQGMNTGIQDAANLGWKIGLALRGAPDSLLDTYERERRPVAKHVVRLTGLAFALEVSRFAPLRWGRRWAARPAASLLLPHPRLVSAVARMVSGLDTRYRHGAIDEDGGSSRWSSGMRLPDRVIDQQGARLHDLIDAGSFHLLVFDDKVDTSSRDWPWEPGVVTIHKLDPPTGSERRHPAWVLVRPDGYIATSNEDSDFGAAQAYLHEWLSRDLLNAPATSTM